MRTRNYLFIGMALLGAGLIFYFSWLPSPDIGTQPYFPKFIGNWIDSHGNLRTAVPFLFMAILGEMFIHTQKKSKGRLRIAFLLAQIVILFIAEIGQLYLPKRHFDWGDIGWGIMGSIAGITIVFGVKQIIKNISISDQ